MSRRTHFRHPLIFCLKNEILSVVTLLLRGGYTLWIFVRRFQVSPRSVRRYARRYDDLAMAMAPARATPLCRIKGGHYWTL